MRHEAQPAWAVEMWTTLRSAPSCPLTHSPYYGGSCRVAPFSIVKWFPFRLSECKPNGQSGSFFDRQMVPFSLDKNNLME